ncbi:MAG: invasion associated locus B family protein [Paracoccaceae bacterium]|nr:invasion associated locus B family protein [Paracoccaceae bacterium]MDG1368662.1 invasion associated locus B family protein [Paracoccaceae bacterium]
MRSILAITFILTALSASAQEQTTQKFGDWTLRCAQQQAGKICSLRQRVVIVEGNQLLAEVSLNIAQIDGQPRVLMVMNSPEGVALNIAPGYIVDERDDVVNLSWRTCVRQFCRAAALLSPQQQGVVMAGNVMVLGYNKFREDKATAFRVSLRGVTAGLAALSAQ